MNSQLMEGTKRVVALAPAADAAGRAGDWIDASKGQCIYVAATINQGNAATVTVTLAQATNNAGAGSKALTGNAKIWANQDAASSDALVQQADGKSFTTSAALATKLVIFKVDPRAAMDINGGFRWLSASTSASNVANITAMDYTLDGLMFKLDAGSLPSVI